MKPLLSNGQLAAVQRMGRSGMRVEVVFMRPVFTAGSLGDDETDPNPATVPQPAEVLDRGRLFGYLRQTGGDSVGGVDVGRIQTTSTFELALPVGTNVETRDLCVIGRIGTYDKSEYSYAVQNVQDDETWPDTLTATLRRGS